MVRRILGSPTARLGVGAGFVAAASACASALGTGSLAALPEQLPVPRGLLAVAARGPFTAS